MTASIATASIEMLPDGRMNTANAARYLGCSPKTLAHMRCYGKGPSFSKPGRVWYFREDLDSWLGSHCRRRSTAQTSHHPDSA
jgi:hypothetical protein